jgi:hypothetical protein
MEFGTRRTVAVVVFDRLAVFETAVPCEVFGIDRSAMGAPPMGSCCAPPTPRRSGRPREASPSTLRTT